MNRRTFLKTLGITSLTGIFAQKVFAKTVLADDRYKNFNPNHHYGDYVCVTQKIKGRDDSAFKEEAMIIQEQIQCIVPPKYRHKIIYKIINPSVPNKDDIYHNVGYFVWRYNP